MKSFPHIQSFHLPPRSPSSDLSTKFEIGFVTQWGITSLKFYSDHFGSTSNVPHLFANLRGTCNLLPRVFRMRPPQTLRYHPAQFEADFTDPNPYNSGLKMAATPIHYGQTLCNTPKSTFYKRIDSRPPRNVMVDPQDRSCPTRPSPQFGFNFSDPILLLTRAAI